MNKQNFNQSFGFPFQTETLDEMQKAYSIFNALGGLAGNLSVISGCIITGSIVSDGAVFIDGEVIEFRGGTIASNVIIVENVTAQEFGDGSEREVLFERYATFGAGLNSIPWADFKRPKNTNDLTIEKAEQSAINALVNRIVALEARPAANVPVGLVAIWGLPLTSIPTGWVEHTPLRGRTAVGKDPAYDISLNTDQTNFNLNTLDSTGGTREHKLTIAQMPKHGHNVKSYAGDFENNISLNINSPTNGPSSEKTSETGGDGVHPNMQPYRVVEFIRYIG